MRQQQVILYIASRLPALSETFVYREVIALRSLGLEIFTASVRKPQTGLGAPELDQMADSSTVVYDGALRIFRDVCLEFASDARQTWRTVLTAIKDSADCPGVRLAVRGKALVHALSGVALARRVRRLRIGRIHAHMAHVPATIGMYASVHCGIPFSFTGHGADLFRDASLLKQKLARASHVICISEWHREVYQRIHRRPVQAYPLVRCGVDVDGALPEPIQSNRTVAHGGYLPMILSVARLVPKKGIDVLIRALARLRLRGIAFRAVVAGDGPELNNLLKLASALGVSGCIEWKRAIAHSKVAGLMRNAAVFALPCVIARDGDRDGIPVALMEAMAAGIPCVSTDFPAIRELIEEKVSGRLVAPGDVLALERAIAALIASPASRASLGAAGRERVESEFSTSLNAQRLFGVFQIEREVVA